MRSSRLAVVALLFATILMGCVRKPYDVPEYKEVGANETAFLIPLEGNTSKQGKFDSAAALEELKIASKRITITHRWNQTGRWEHTGSYIAAVKLILVDRSPVTREWTVDKSTGTTSKDQAIWAESKDSVGFSTGFSVTAAITETNAALFLYMYPNKSLATIMDSEIRARVQAAFSDASALYDLSELRAEKAAVIASVRADVIPFFEGRGITITTVGMFGGLSYENEKIQDSIDKVFIAQREKEINKAMLDAQSDKNKTIELEAEATAEKERRIARGIADGKQMLLDVAKNAGKDPAFLELRRFEVEEARIAKWDGKYPTYYMSMGAQGEAPMLMLQVPPVEQTRAASELPLTAAPVSDAPAPMTLGVKRTKYRVLLSELQAEHNQASPSNYKTQLASRIRGVQEALRTLQ